MNDDKKNKLRQLLRKAIIDTKSENTEFARKLAYCDQRIKNGCNENIECSKISRNISIFLVTHHYRAPKSVMELQSFVSKISQEYRGEISPIMWFQ